MNYFTSKTAEQLTLVSISHAREGKAGELKKACLDLIEKTRQEEGAISYHLYEDREDPCQFIFHEIWANEELWKKHTQSLPINRLFLISSKHPSNCSRRIDALEPETCVLLSEFIIESR